MHKLDGLDVFCDIIEVISVCEYLWQKIMGDMVLSNFESMSVVDVYDLASDIGKECEKIIDLFGADSVTALMPKVINILELLEAMATRNESENTKLQELNDRIAHLECEKHERAMFRERYQKVGRYRYRQYDMVHSLLASLCKTCLLWYGGRKGSSAILTKQSIIIACLS